MSITPLVHQSATSCTNTHFSHLWYTREPPPVQTHVHHTFGTPEPHFLYQSHAKSLATSQASRNYDKTCGIFLNNNRMNKRKNSRKTERVTVMAYMERQITEMKALRRLGTARNYTRARNSFSSFLKGHDVSFRRMDENLILGYNNWLGQRGVVKNTISFYMRILRALYNKAAKDRRKLAGMRPASRSSRGLLKAFSLRSPALLTRSRNWLLQAYRRRSRHWTSTLHRGYSVRSVTTPVLVS